MRAAGTDAGGAARLRDPLVVAGVAAAGTLALALVDPRTSGVWPTCPLLALTGLACPLCGGLRAVHDLTRGDVAAAWGSNPLLVALVVPALVAWAAWLVRTVRTSRPARPRSADGPGPGSGRPSARVARGAGPALLVVLVLFGVLRNVPALAPVLGP